MPRESEPEALLVREIETSNATRGGRVTKMGQELAAIAKMCGDKIWAQREKVTFPEDVVFERVANTLIHKGGNRRHGK